MQIPYAPYRVYLDITNKCPNSCRHCYIDRSSCPNEELDLNQLKSFVSQLAYMDIKYVIITGGEPFMRSDLFDLLWWCRDSKINTVVVTSGVLLDRKKIQLLREIGVKLRISLDGVSAKTHDYIRGTGAFENFVDNVNLLNQEKMEWLSVHFTLNRLNLKELLGLPSFLRELRIHEIVLSTIKPAGRAKENPELLIEPALVSFARERIKLISRNINIAHYSEKNWQSFSCPAAFAKCGITSDGRITPCVFLGLEFLGKSIKDYSFKYLWQNDEMLNTLRNLSSNNGCLNCSHVSCLNGGCRARALYFNNNDIDSMDPYCCEIKNFVTYNFLSSQLG